MAVFADQDQVQLVQQAAAIKGVSVEEFVEESLEGELCALAALKDTDELWAKIIQFPVKN